MGDPPYEAMFLERVEEPGDGSTRHQAAVAYLMGRQRAACTLDDHQDVEPRTGQAMAANVTVELGRHQALGADEVPLSLLHAPSVASAAGGFYLRDGPSRQLRVFAGPLSYDRFVAYDERLADRIRELLAGEPGVTEKKMFGGLAFLIGGNMAVAASGQGGVLVRVDPTRSDELVATTNARFMEMRGREMPGWLRIGPEDVRTKRELAKWVRMGAKYARSLPVKR